MDGRSWWNRRYGWYFKRVIPLIGRKREAVYFNIYTLELYFEPIRSKVVNKLPYDTAVLSTPPTYLSLVDGSISISR